MRRIITILLAHLPTKLPVGIPEFEEWANSILDISGRFADENSMKFMLATTIMHADAKHGYLPKMYFVTRLRKAAANQVASQVFHDIKTKQAELAAQAAAEATVETPDQASNEETAN